MSLADKRKFIANDGIIMINCKPLHFIEEATFKSGAGPVLYTIHIKRNKTSSYTCYFDKVTLTLTICKFNDSEPGDPLSFKVESIEEASEWIKRFADGMKVDMRSTIFMYHTHQKGKYVIGDKKGDYDWRNQRASDGLDDGDTLGDEIWEVDNGYNGYNGYNNQ